MPQPKLHWSMHLWPGLAPLWLRGSWVGLIVAVGFTALANILAVATFVWNEWLTSQVRWTAFGALAAVWLLAWIESRAVWRRLVAELSGAPGAGIESAELSDRWFREAQAAYLAGDWVATEQALLKLLKQDARDAEARLMLATLWGHQGRSAAATEQLDLLDRLEAAAPWKNEITWERERIGAASVIQEHQPLKITAVSEQAAADNDPIEATSRLAA